VEKRS